MKRNLRCHAGAVVSSVLAAALLVGATSPGISQTPPSILVISQRAQGTDKAGYINIAPHLEPALRDAGKLDVLVFRPDMPGLKALVDSKQVDPKDTVAPLSKAAAHRLAKALGAHYLLTVSPQTTPDGISAQAETEANLALDQWTTLSSEKILPAHRKGKQPSLLETVHVFVAGLVQKVQQAISNSPARVAQPGVPQVSEPKTASQRLASRAAETPAGEIKAGPSISEQPAAERNARAAPGSPERGTPLRNQGAATIRPSNLPSTYELLVDKARRNGDMANLLIALRRAVTEKPHDVRLRRDLVKAYTDRGWHDLAREEATRAVELAPNDAGLHRVLGDTLLETGETDAALAEFHAAVRLAPNDAAGYVSLGDAYANLGKPDESRKAFEDAAKADPRNPAPFRRMARLYALNGKYADSLAAFNMAKSLTPAEELGGFRTDHAALLSGIQSLLAEISAGLASARKAFVNGTTNRENTHTTVTRLRKKAEEIGAYLDQVPDVGFGRAQALYAQAATLLAQTADKYLDYLETQNSSEDEEASLMRIEAAKQLGDADKTLKAQLEPKK
jgi:Flp pilus assembly protein TadD